MNKLNKIINREAKCLSKNKGCSFKIARKIIKFTHKTSWCSPCEDCDNMYCNKPKRIYAYCPNNM